MRLSHTTFPVKSIPYTAKSNNLYKKFLANSKELCSELRASSQDLQLKLSQAKKDLCSEMRANN